MTTRVFLIRHGYTIWNHEFRYQGHTDIELSPEGIIQARDLCKRMRQEKLSAIFSSDLKRAYQTARIIAEPHNLEVQIVPQLKEICFGVWEGLTYEDLQKKYPQELAIWLKTPHLLKIQDAETFAELRDRAVGSLYELVSKFPAAQIAIVSHGGTIAALICGLLKEPLEKMWQYKQKNAALNIIDISKKEATIRSINDTSHLTIT